ncbi:hypothetical protein D3C76_1228960 [compost metagenome]
MRSRRALRDAAGHPARQHPGDGEKQFSVSERVGPPLQPGAVQPAVRGGGGSDRRPGHDLYRLRAQGGGSDPRRHDVRERVLQRLGGNDAQRAAGEHEPQRRGVCRRREIQRRGERALLQPGTVPRQGGAQRAQYRPQQSRLRPIGGVSGEDRRRPVAVACPCPLVSLCRRAADRAAALRAGGLPLSTEGVDLEHDQPAVRRPGAAGGD